MKAIRTKRRKQKRFDWEKTETTCVFVVTGNTWYMRQVDCWRLGDWAYHWLYDGYYSIFYVPSGSLIGHVVLESKARSIIKKLNIKIKTPGPTYKVHLPWIIKVKGVIKEMSDILYNLPESVTYNPDEDIPF